MNDDDEFLTERVIADTHFTRICNDNPTDVDLAVVMFSLWVDITLTLFKFGWTNKKLINEVLDYYEHWIKDEENGS